MAANGAPGAFTVEHFRRYASLLVFDDDERHEPEDWQLEVARDVFRKFREAWMIVPEGNSKTTFAAQLALYGADYSPSPWIPVGASSSKQARILYDQAEGFVTRTPGMGARFRCFGGYILIRSVRNGGRGIEIFAHDPKTGDGVIPYPYAILDELHRHPDMRFYRLWKGKLRKRGAQILAISTAGEPETEFENTRDTIRRKATKRRRRGAHLRAEGKGVVLHEWMVDRDAWCSDMARVKAANPLSTITEETLAEDFDSPTLDLGDWKRLKCNRPTRSSATAVSDGQWDEAQAAEGIPAKADVDVGLDVGWKWDTTALVPCQTTERVERGRAVRHRLLGPAEILVPPRDGNMLHPDEIKQAMLGLASEYRVHDVVMDMSRAEDVAHWIEDELGLKVIDRNQGNTEAVEDYEAFMDGLRNGTLKHSGDPGLRAHVLNAIARRLPGGDFRFDRPTPGRNSPGMQDQRVIDALTAAAMVVQHSTRKKKRRSVYEDRFKRPPEAA